MSVKRHNRPTWEFELSLSGEAAGFSGGPVAGVDEAGRGALCGPVVAGAAVFARPVEIDGLDDSKRLSARQRERLFDILVSDPDIKLGVGIMDHRVIDRHNILQATVLAMRAALGSLAVRPGLLLVDGLALEYESLPCRKVIGGDALCPSIAAASIVAKVVRDRIMDKFDRLYPGYGFAGHKGYGTAQHMRAMAGLGLCAIHRKTFQPCAQLSLF